MQECKDTVEFSTYTYKNKAYICDHFKLHVKTMYLQHYWHFVFLCQREALFQTLPFCLVLSKKQCDFKHFIYEERLVKVNVTL